MTGLIRQESSRRRAMSGRDKGQYQAQGLGANAQGPIYLHILH